MPDLNELKEEHRSMQIEWGQTKNDTMTETYFGIYIILKDGIFIKTHKKHELFYPFKVIRRFEALPYKEEDNG